MRFLTLLVSVLSLSASLAHAGGDGDDRVSPLSFLGNYVLVAQPEGMLCDQNMQALRMPSVTHQDDGYMEISLGAFVFEGVNNGPQRFEDSLSVSNSNAYTTADGSMIDGSREVSKSDGEVTTSFLKARLVGNRLTIFSHTTYDHGHGYCNSTEFKCVYRKIDSDNGGK